MLVQSQSREAQSSGVPVAAASTAGAVLGGTVALAPSAFARPVWWRVPATIGVGLLAGAGVGAAAGGLTSLATSDAVIGGGTLAGAGLATAALGKLIPNAGRIRDLGSMVTSAGVLAAAGGTVVAGTGALQRTDLPGSSSDALTGIGTGVAAGATAMGGLALAGALRRPPTIAAATRDLLVPASGALDGMTPEVASNAVKSATARAKADFLSLPGATEETWNSANGIPKGIGYLRSVATTDEIERTTGRAALGTPRRIYVGLNEAPTPEARAALTLDRLKAAGMEKYGTIHVVAPTMAGDTSDALPLAMEHATRGDTLTVMTHGAKVNVRHPRRNLEEAVTTLRMTLEGIQQHLDRTVPEGAQRPRVQLSGICFGTLAPIKLEERLPDGLRSLGVDNALFMGAPAFSRSARALAGKLDRGESPGVLVRNGADLAEHASPAAAPPVTFLVSRDDALRAGLHSMVVPFPMRDKQVFMPVVSGFSNYFDSGLDSPARGMYRDVGHQFSIFGTKAVSSAHGIPLDPDVKTAIDQATVVSNARGGLHSLHKLEQKIAGGKFDERGLLAAVRERDAQREHFRSIGAPV